MQSSRKSVCAFLTTLGGALLVTALLNLTVNPYGHFPLRVLKPVVWSSRQDKVDWMATSFGRRPPQVLVLGSSRVMKIRSTEIEQVSGKRAYNAGVDSGRVEDAYALFAYARVLGAPLSDLVIGIDLDAFHDAVPTDARLLATAQLRRFVPLDVRLDWYPRVAAGLVSYSQARDSLRSLSMAVRGYPPEVYRFDEDGFIHYLEWEPKIAAGTFRPDFEHSKEEYDSRFAQWGQVSPMRVELLKKLVSEAATQGIAVRAFLTPFHRSLIEHLRVTREFDRHRSEVTNVMVDLMNEHSNFSFMDFTEATSFGGETERFLDGSHPDEENSARIVRALWTGRTVDAQHALQ
jgi:hypothetical protein